MNSTSKLYLIEVYILLFGLTLFVHSNMAMGQSTKHPYYKFDKFSSKDGLPQNSILGILQDETGFVWFGTDDGLARFDGYNFEIYKHNPENENSIRSNVIRGLCQDRNGFIWIATEGGGLNIFNPISEKFIGLNRNVSLFPNSIPDKVYSIMMDDSGEIWIGTLSDGIFRISYKSIKERNFKNLFENLNITHYTTDNSDLRDNKIWGISQDKSGLLWIGTFEAGLQTFDKNTNNFNDYNITFNNRKISSVKSFLEDSKGNRWIGTEHNGLFVQEKSTGQLNQISQLQMRSKNPNAYPNISSIIEDQHGNIWIGTLGDGMSVYDRDQKQFFHYGDDPNNPYSLKGNSVFTLYEDKEGSIWIGMYSGEGLRKITPHEQHFEHFQSSSHLQGSLSGKMVKSIYKDSQKRLWVGTFNHGLNLWDEKTKVFTHYNTTSTPKLSHNNIQSIIETRDGSLWLGTDGGGINKIDIDGNVKIYQHDPSDLFSISKNEVWAILEDHNGYIWVATANGGGLNRFDPKTERFKRLFKNGDDESGPNFNDIRVLYQDSQKNLWVGTYGGGLNKYEFESETFKYYFNDPTDPHSISNDIITSILEDRNGNLWLGTFGGGLNQFNPNSEKFTRFREKDGLPSDVIKALVQDRKGDLWISTVNGISRFNISSNTFKNFTISEGLQSDEFNLGAAFMDDLGKIYFGGANGMNAFYPEDVSIEKPVKKPKITGFRILNEKIIPEQEVLDRIILDKSILFTDELDLYHQHNSFEFEFSSLEFVGQDKIRYAYKLEGFDENWVFTDSKRRFASYSNLNPGKYSFKVKASTESGYWSDEESVIQLNIYPPWWKSNPAYLVYVCIFAIIAYIIKSFIVFRLKAKNDLRFERIEKQKQEEVNQLKLRFFTNVSHELRTPLMLIIAPLDHLVKKEILPEPIQNQLLSVQANTSRLLKLINQLLEFRKQETGNIKLKVRELNPIAFVEQIYKAFEGLAEIRKINFSLVIGPNLPSLVWMDMEQMEKVLYNLCYNAFKFTSEGGTIKLRMDVGKINPEDSDGLLISVIDSGKGIKPEHIDKIFDRFFQVDQPDSSLSPGTGIGLALSKNIIEYHHGKISVTSIPGSITEFTIYLKLGNKHFSEDELIYTSKEYVYSKPHDIEFMYMEPKELESPYKSEINKKTKTLLLVEDNYELAKLIENVLRENYNVITADNGSDGIIKATKHLPDLVISDVMMPLVNGNQLVAALKSDVTTCHIPIILLTAKSNYESQKEGYDSGADDYLCKPFPLDLLVKKINNIFLTRESLIHKFKTRPDLEPTEITITSSDEKLLKSAIQVVEDHIDDPSLDINKLVKEVGMSRSLFFEKIKGITGQTPLELIQILRLKRAAQLLLNSDLKISDITFMVGYNNPKYFSKCFQKQFGVSPSKYKIDKLNDDSKKSTIEIEDFIK